MDVILDTNIIYSLIQSHGAEFITKSGSFTDLTTYLRRTGSVFVIPEVVHDEFAKKYSDLLAQRFKDSRDAWESLHRNLVKSHDYPHRLNVQKELEQILHRLINPAKGVIVAVYNDYSCAPVKEVVRRGIYRIRPASSKGEELRDVVIWLMAIACARTKPIAFISDDGIYAEKGTLHPDLQKDLADHKVEINFYTSINEFTKANALTARKLTAEEIAPFIKEGEVEKMIQNYVLGKSFDNKNIVKVEMGNADFVDATQYEISADSSYVEARFTSKSQVELHQVVISWINQAYLKPEAESPKFMLSDLVYLPTETIINFPISTPPSGQAITFKVDPPKPTITNAGITFQAEVIIRITNGDVESTELDMVFADYSNPQD